MDKTYYEKMLDRNRLIPFFKGGKMVCLATFYIGNEEDVDRLEEIIHLTHKLGVNLAGVEVILRLQKQVKKMQKEMNHLFRNAQEELSRETEVNKKSIKEAAERLVQLKKERTTVKSLQVEGSLAFEYDDE